MPKKRKTRKQKISLEQKRQEVHETVSPVDSSTPSSHQTIATTEAFSLPTNYHQSTQKERTTVAQPTTISTGEYGYLGKDLMKSAVLSGSIVIAELLIRLFYSH